MAKVQIKSEKLTTLRKNSDCSFTFVFMSLVTGLSIYGLLTSVQKREPRILKELDGCRQNGED